MIEDKSTQSVSWQPGQIVSLLDMIQGHAKQFFQIATELERAKLMAMFTPKAMQEYLMDAAGAEGGARITLQRVQELCRDLGLVQSDKKIDRIVPRFDKWLPGGDFTSEQQMMKSCQELSKDLLDLSELIESELEEYRFLHMASAAVQYYNENQFPESVVSEFCEDYDMLEAGKCLALGLYTACACHLMRVAELGIKKIERAYSLKEMRTWGDFLSQFRTYAHEVASKESAQKEKDIMAIHARLVGVKDAWRDDTMHVARTYNAREAREVFVAVKNFMILVTNQLP